MIHHSHVIVCNGHGSCPISVVGDIEVGQEEKGSRPRAPLTVAVNRANSHEHLGAVRKGIGTWDVVGTADTGGSKRVPEGGIVPITVRSRAPLRGRTQVHFHILPGVHGVTKTGGCDGFEEEIAFHPSFAILNGQIHFNRSAR